MARFDIYALNRAEVPYVLEVQADLLSELASVVVVPLVPADAARAETMRKLKPEITIKGKSFCLMTTDIAILPDELTVTDAAKIWASDVRHCQPC